MIDDDDVSWVALLWPFEAHPIVAAFGIFVVIGVAYVACENTKECEAMKCDHGAAQLVDHRCLCVEEPSHAH